MTHTATARAPEQHGLLDQLDGELWLARRLGKHGVLVVFDGDTTTEQRKARMREAILERGLETVICGRGVDGKPNTYGQAFRRLYREDL